MRSIWYFGGVLSAALALSGCEPRSEAPADKPAETASMTDEDMLDAQLDAFETAWAAGDAKAIADTFVADGDFVDPSGTMFEGKDAIEKRYQGLLGTTYKGTQVALTMTSSRFPSPDVAIAEGDFEITGMKSSGGADLPAMKGQYTTVSVKQDGKWMVHCSRPMVPMPAPGQ
jgi:uncharacterized protein (TIGR02246 family)